MSTTAASERAARDSGDPPRDGDSPGDGDPPRDSDPPGDSDPPRDGDGTPPDLPKAYQKPAASAGDPSAPLFYYCVLLGAALIGCAFELGVRQPEAYLDPGFGPPRWLASLSALIAAIAAGLFGRRALSAAQARLPWLLLALAAVVGLSAPALFVAFGRGPLVHSVALLIPPLGGALIGATFTAAWRAVGRTALQLGLLERALDPFRLLGVAVSLAVAAGAATLVGLMRSSVAVAATLMALAFWTPGLVEYLERIPVARARAARRTALLGFVLCLAGFAAAEVMVPLEVLRNQLNEVVYVHPSERTRYVVTSGQDSFELFADGALKASSLDGYRYYESLVHPALALAPKNPRVLVLGSGDGMAEREVLRHPDVLGITSVVTDAGAARLAQRLAWLRRLTADSMHSPKVRLVRREPILWLAEDTEQYDAIVVDLADPDGYLQGKNYTRYFYELVAQRLSPRGVAVVQATSPFRSPKTFAIVAETLRAAGLDTTPYHAPVPTFGDWGFVLAARRPLPTPDNVPADLVFLDADLLDAMFELPDDLLAHEPVAPSTLHDQQVVETFAEEREARGL